MNKMKPTHLRKPMKRCFISLLNSLAIVVMAVFLSMDSAVAGEAPSLEYQVKGACLIKFGMFVEWPAAPNVSASKPPFIIGILGEDPFGKTFDEAVTKEKVNGRQVVIKRSKTASELLDCQIVFIAASETNRLMAVFATLSTNGVLTVSDAPGFARNGGIVGFFKEDGKVRFEINSAVADLHGLKVSSKLLQVGRIVADGKSNQG